MKKFFISREKESRCRHNTTFNVDDSLKGSTSNLVATEDSKALSGGENEDRSIYYNVEELFLLRRFNTVTKELLTIGIEYRCYF